MPLHDVAGAAIEVIDFLRTGIPEFIPSDETRLLRYARNDCEGPARKDG